MEASILPASLLGLLSVEESILRVHFGAFLLPGPVNSSSAIKGHSVSFFGDVRSCRVVCAVLCFIISVVSDFVDLSLQYPLSVEFSWQKYWRGFPCPHPRDLPDPGIEPESPASLALQVDSLPLSH